MKKTTTILCLIVSILVGCQSKPEPANELVAEQLLLATAWYQQSAEMRACYYQAYSLAEMALAQNLAAYKGTKPAAVVMDIDETVLDNSPFEAKLIADNAEYSRSRWEEWSQRGSARALPGVAKFIAFAQSKGVAVKLISNRQTDEIAKTLQNLREQGIKLDSTDLLFIAPGESSCKDSRREQVAANYEIILLIGDSLGDFTSEFDNRDTTLALGLVDSLQNLFGTRYIILPNPMYGEWQGAIINHDFSQPHAQQRKLILNRLQK
ncbi:MAG: 5'-nucleotidase, lipoprotein e(P4) family [Salinivirgaceae bacterium]|nr:5'-nucleotidase, lipoprotein e(P4) family [Salinivirgaceae bacterium]